MHTKPNPQTKRDSYYRNLPSKEANRAALRFLGGVGLIIIGLISLGNLIMFRHYDIGRFSGRTLVLAYLVSGSIAVIGGIVIWRLRVEHRMDTEE